MKTDQWPVTCDVCGGEGAGDITTSAAQWLKDSFISHRDPRICAEILKQKKIKNQTK